MRVSKICSKLTELKHVYHVELRAWGLLEFKQNAPRSDFDPRGYAKWIEEKWRAERSRNVARQRMNEHQVVCATCQRNLDFLDASAG